MLNSESDAPPPSEPLAPAPPTAPVVPAQSRKRKRAPATAASPAPSEPGSNGNTAAELVDFGFVRMAISDPIMQSPLFSCGSIYTSSPVHIPRAPFLTHDGRLRVLQNRAYWRQSHRIPLHASRNKASWPFCTMSDH